MMGPYGWPLPPALLAATFPYALEHELADAPDDSAHSSAPRLPFLGNRCFNSMSMISTATFGSVMTIQAGHS
jgi:hypothetical protein